MRRRTLPAFSLLVFAVLLTLACRAQQKISGPPCVRPVAFFGGKTNGAAICSSLARAAYGVIVECQDLEGDRDTTTRLEVLGFRLVVVQLSHIGPDPVYRRVSLSNHGGLLTDRSRKAVFYATIGDSLLIRNIRVRDRDGRKLKVPDLQFALSGCGQDPEVPSIPVVVSTPNTSELYRAVENPVDIAVPGVPCSSLSVRSSSGKIRGEACSYYVTPGAEHELTLYVDWKDMDGKASTASSRHRVKELPAVAKFAGADAKDDSLSTGAAKAALGMIARVVGGGFDLNLEIKGYRLVLERECRSIFDGPSTEATLTNAMLQALQTCSAGDRLYVTEITAKFPSGAEKALDDLRFVLY